MARFMLYLETAQDTTPAKMALSILILTKYTEPKDRGDLKAKLAAESLPKEMASYHILMIKSSLY